MNAPKRKPRRPTARLIKPADDSPAAERRLKAAMKRVSEALPPLAMRRRMAFLPAFSASSSRSVSFATAFVASARPSSASAWAPSASVARPSASPAFFAASLIASLARSAAPS